MVALAAASAGSATAVEQQQQAKVAVVTTVGCPYCKKAKEALTREGISYEEVELSSNLELLNKIKAETGRRTVPQIFANGSLIGGADDLLKLIANSQLQPLLDSATKPALPSSIREAVESGAQTSKAGPADLFTPKEWTPAQTQRVLKAADAIRAALDQRVTHMQAGGGSDARQFTAVEAVQWLRKAGANMEAAKALELLSMLQQAQQVTVISGRSDALASEACLSPASSVTLRFVSDAPQPRRGEPLNVHFRWFGPTRSGSEVAEVLRQMILSLYDRHLSPDGRKVNYAALRADAGFQDYVNASAALQRVDLAAMSPDERKAFFINIYNAMVVHGIALFGPAKTWLTRLGWFSSIKYEIGGLVFSADDIEHGVLRGNSPPPTSLPVLLKLPQFAKGAFRSGDPRLSQVLPKDPRIHFTLVCGAKSCPPIKVYTPASLEEGLDGAAASFCESEVIIDKARRTVTLSKILLWYRGDFGSTDEEVLTFVARFLAEGPRRDLLELLKSGPVSLEYKEYDWGTNE